MARPKKAAAPKKKAGPASRSKGSAPDLYTDPALRDRLKAEITAGEKGGKAGQWSARKAQLLAAEYKKAGGEYKKKGDHKAESQEHLDQWTDEKWKTADGKPAIKADGETARYLPEKAWDELSPAEKKATDSKKKAGSKEGEQYVANTEPAKKARKKASGPKKAGARAKPKAKS